MNKYQSVQYSPTRTPNSFVIPYSTQMSNKSKISKFNKSIVPTMEMICESVKNVPSGTPTAVSRSIQGKNSLNNVKNQVNKLQSSKAIGQKNESMKVIPQVAQQRGQSEGNIYNIIGRNNKISRNYRGDQSTFIKAKTHDRC